MAEKMLKHGANPDFRDRQNKTLIRNAIDSRKFGTSEYEKIQLLLRYGADPNALLTSGASYLQFSPFRGS